MARLPLSRLLRNFSNFAGEKCALKRTVSHFAGCRDLTGYPPRVIRNRVVPAFAVSLSVLHRVVVIVVPGTGIVGAVFTSMTGAVDHVRAACKLFASDASACAVDAGSLHVVNERASCFSWSQFSSRIVRWLRDVLRIIPSLDTFRCRCRFERRERGKPDRSFPHDFFHE